MVALTGNMVLAMSMALPRILCRSTARDKMDSMDGMDSMDSTNIWCMRGQHGHPGGHSSSPCSPAAASPEEPGSCVGGMDGGGESESEYFREKGE